MWNVTVLGEKKWKESRQAGSGLELQESAFISTVEPPALAFIGGGERKLLLWLWSYSCFWDLGCRNRQQSWSLSLRTHLDIFFVSFPALPLLLISLCRLSLLLKTLSGSQCKPHSNPSLFLLFLPSPLSLLFSLLRCFYIILSSSPVTPSSRIIFLVYIYEISP